MPYVVRQIVEKATDSRVNPPVNIGALSRDVVDKRPKQTDQDGNVIYPADSKETGYSFAQFVDHYMAFMKEVPFIFIGEPNKPDKTISNNHVGIWLDTSVKSNTQWETRAKL